MDTWIFDDEGQLVGARIVSQPIRAKSRKLKEKWTLEVISDDPESLIVDTWIKERD